MSPLCESITLKTTEHYYLLLELAFSSFSWSSNQNQGQLVTRSLQLRKQFHSMTPYFRLKSKGIWFLPPHPHPLFNKRESFILTEKWTSEVPDNYGHNRNLRHTQIAEFWPKNMLWRIYIVQVGLKHIPISRGINHFCLSSNYTQLIRAKSYTFSASLIYNPTSGWKFWFYFMQACGFWKTEDCSISPVSPLF